MPYIVLIVGIILIAVSLYLAVKQQPIPQTNTAELEELMEQIQLTADDAIARLDEKLSQAEFALAREQPQPPTFAQQVKQLAASGLSLEEIAAKLGKGKGEIQLALGLANFGHKEQGS